MPQGADRHAQYFGALKVRADELREKLKRSLRAIHATTAPVDVEPARGRQFERRDGADRRAGTERRKWT